MVCLWSYSFFTQPLSQASGDKTNSFIGWNKINFKIFSEKNVLCLSLYRLGLKNHTWTRLTYAKTKNLYIPKGSFACKIKETRDHRILKRTS